MVVKKRNPLSFGAKDDRYLLPVVLKEEYDRQSKGPKMRPLNERLEKSEWSKDDAALWRKSNAKRFAHDQVLPTFSSSCSPQVLEKETLLKPLPSKSTIVFTARKRRSNLQTLLLLTLLSCGLFAYMGSKATLRQVNSEISDVAYSHEKLHLKARSTEMDAGFLEREVFTLDMMHQRHLELVAELRAREAISSQMEGKTEEDELEMLQSKMEAEHENADELRRHVQRVSRENAIQKFGSGPHRVEIIVELSDGPHSFVVELASLDLMPHSVHIFLEMVLARLWDESSFILKDENHIKAAPLLVTGPNDSDKLTTLAGQGFDHLAFSEYNAGYTHKKYTLGFSTDNTLSWYINTKDNTATNKGKPCFATIVDGFDTVSKLETSPTSKDNWFQHRIEIKHVKLL